MTEEGRIVRVGSRKSQLALIQTHGVVAKLKTFFPNITFQIISMSTTGDKVLDKALSKIGEKSLFTKELEYALEDKRVDFVVHSLKDLPTTLPPGMVIGAVCKRDNPHDAIMLHPKHKGKTLADLPKDSVIGTSSLRRASQLRRKYPHLKYSDIRGNLNTRKKKLDEADNYDAIVLAVAGLERMGWSDRIDQILLPDECMYSVSQGAVAVECRDGDLETIRLLSKLHHFETVIRVVAERAFLRTLEGGCSVPVAIHTEIIDDNLFMKGGVFSIDGTESVIMKQDTSIASNDEPPTKKLSPTSPKQYSSIVAEGEDQDVLNACEKLGMELAQKVGKAGGRDILAAARKETDAAILAQQQAPFLKQDTPKVVS
ncbi:unnamed protein product [Owenia fusiformis]|uniref:hydroxymethylbilane synthase n=1 Tax=Owenia fusiformis TaxID=6347 RepID=A0A8J1TZ51_OWEFU|nr:unnamed protein product [Owenia fusiformis]